MMHYSTTWASESSDCRMSAAETKCWWMMHHARSLKYTGGDDLGQPSASAYLDPFYSPSGSFIQLETIDNPIPCGTQKNVRLLYTAKESTEFELQYQILKQGEVVRTGSQKVTFNVEDDVSNKYESTEEVINGSETQISPELSASELSESSSSEENCPSARETRYIFLIFMDAFIRQLPKFEVSIKFPPYVLENAESIPVSVCAQYTYGKPVQAHLNLNTSLEMYEYESSYYRTPILQNSLELDGCYNYTINVTEIDPKRQNNYKRIQVSANVIEVGTGVEVNKTEYLDRSYTPLYLDFSVDGNHGQYYKPGLPYNGKLKVSHPDHTPAPGEAVEICATVSRKRIIDTWLATKEVKFCKNYTSDADGYIRFALVPQNVDSTSISLEARSLKYTGGPSVRQRRSIEERNQWDMLSLKAVKNLIQFQISYKMLSQVALQVVIGYSELIRNL
ncbi:hypothetical protein AVEN_248243-1 [Araneus ventricosus]|uniref:Uncharacterized protein n=1 Tax=Araneus ventricosus TaxID=182803 RepID=A0A4Y2NY78_ARAVE|nr:hypothetical protein AVEN_248243-1 [Araneus ventricosus]